MRPRREGAAELRALLAPFGRDLAALREVVGDERLEPLRRRLAACHDLASTLSSAREVSLSELPQTIDLVEIAQQATAQLEGRAERQGVKVEVRGADEAQVRVRPKALLVLLRELLSQAITATPRDATVVVTVDALAGGAGARLAVEDAGASLPAAMRGPFMRLEVEPSTYGRASAIPLHSCAEFAQAMGISLEFGDAPSGLRVAALFSR